MILNLQRVVLSPVIQHWSNISGISAIFPKIIEHPHGEEVVETPTKIPKDPKMDWNAPDVNLYHSESLSSPRVNNIHTSYDHMITRTYIYIYT